jgi:hypothetical protein
MRTAGKKSKRNKRWEEVVTYQQIRLREEWCPIYKDPALQIRLLTLLTWSLSPWVKTSIFSKYKGQKHVLDLPSFMTATRSRFIPWNKDK